MQNLRLIIAEDDVETREILKQYLFDLPDITVVGEASTGKELIEHISILEPNLLLADIDMPEMDGVTAVKKGLEILPNLKVIFITGHEEFAIDAIELQAVHYLVKPIERYQLLRAIKRAGQEIAKDEEKMYQHTRLNKKLIVKTIGETHLISKEEVIFVEKIDKKSIIHTNKGTYEMNSTLGAILNQLGDYFFQSHQSYLVNLKHINRITASGSAYLLHFKGYDQVAYLTRDKFSSLCKIVTVKYF